MPNETLRDGISSHMFLVQRAFPAESALKVSTGIVSEVYPMPTASHHQPIAEVLRQVPPRFTSGSSVRVDKLMNADLAWSVKYVDNISVAVSSNSSMCTYR
jgi:hypothetical protein